MRRGRELGATTTTMVAWRLTGPMPAIEAAQHYLVRHVNDKRHSLVAPTRSGKPSNKRNRNCSGCPAADSSA
jgi:hypothetical protein